MNKSLYQYLITIGSNLGNRQLFISNALKKIQLLELEIINKSELFENPPQMAADLDFINCSIIIETSIEPESMLSLLQKIEDQMDRDRSIQKGNRTIDLDISFARYKSSKEKLWTQLIWNTAELVIPHPLAHKRNFVLKTASEIAPDWKHPKIKDTIIEIWLKHKPTN